MIMMMIIMMMIIIVVGLIIIIIKVMQKCNHHLYTMGPVFFIEVLYSVCIILNERSVFIPLKQTIHPSIYPYIQLSMIIMIPDGPKQNRKFKSI